MTIREGNHVPSAKALLALALIVAVTGCFELRQRADRPDGAIDARSDLTANDLVSEPPADGGDAGLDAPQETGLDTGADIGVDTRADISADTRACTPNERMCGGGCFVPGAACSAGVGPCARDGGLTCGTPELRQLAVGCNHACALDAVGAVRCWGSNARGQLGDGTRLARTTPVRVTGLPEVAVEVAAGCSHTCVRLASGGVRCWGSNESGQSGDNNVADRLNSVPLLGLTSARQLALGTDHACALLASGLVHCWGSNRNGQLGDGSLNNHFIPAAVASLRDVVEITAGLSFTCARTRGGAVSCWGANFDGQLGNSATSGSQVPTAVAGLPSVVEVRAGDSHTCARTQEGAVWCWGSNRDGQLGQLGGAALPSRSTPGVVAGLTGVAELSLGGSFSCARSASGALLCWGLGTSGELGEGSLTSNPTPHELQNVSNVAEVDLGLAGGCARVVDGSARCWGSNAN